MMAQTPMTTQRKMRHKTEDRWQYYKHSQLVTLIRKKATFCSWTESQKINIKEKLSEVLQIDIVQEIIEIDPTHIENPEHQNIYQKYCGSTFRVYRHTKQISALCYCLHCEYSRINTIASRYSLMEIRFLHNRDQDMPTSDVFPPWQIVNPSRRATIPNNKKTIKRIRRQ
ncbi:hypothetical protein V1478_000050 [Vespula squamosa]|uniref:Uncharacterized protein n=1 Tax=Vespula squamosa TaxID=30214 RepID=A0ABD2C914_VESSQ